MKVENVVALVATLAVYGLCFVGIVFSLIYELVKKFILEIRKFILIAIVALAPLRVIITRAPKSEVTFLIAIDILVMLSAIWLILFKPDEKHLTIFFIGILFLIAIYSVLKWRKKRG